MKWQKPKVAEEKPPFIKAIARLKDICLEESAKLRKQAEEIRKQMEQEEQNG
jgi:hypothetical protein